jgi:prepilin-type N-terminal cleavage/methylation domain-containing protein
MSRADGFTLIEILISMTISLLGIAAALTVLAVQNASFARQSGLGASVAQSESGLDSLERAVRMAGTGIDPQMGFDFDFYKCVLPGGALAMADSAGCNTALGTPSQRDQVAQPDELVVAYRDPGYSTAAPADARANCSSAGNGTFVGRVWGVTAANGGGSITLALKPGDQIYRGQVLQIVCNDGVTYTYATAGNPGTVAASATSCLNVAFNLYTANISATDPYNQPAALAAACFSNGGTNAARTYAVRRNRFFVHRDLSNPAIPHSYLMLDQGLDLDDDGSLTDADLWPIAADVVDLQLAYATEQPGIMALSTAPVGWVQGTYVTDSDTNGIWGDDASNTSREQLTEPVFAGAGNTATAQFNAANTALFASGAQSCTAFAGVAFYQYPCLFGTTPVETSSGNNIFAYRWTAWTGNISQVQIGLIAQGPVIEENAQHTTDEKDLPPLFNRPALAYPAYNAWYASIKSGGRKRVIVRTGVRPVNMAASAPYWN